ncbi:MAG: cadherin-like beta sandwich domain-containing protein [Clostridiales bacterium]|nr:cadherin-like beta sandwich domain-containing protein [Clostridiales bacterium]
MKWKAMQNLGLLLVVLIMLSLFPGASLSARIIEDDRAVINWEQMENAMSTGYGSNGKFLAPVDAPHPSSTPIYTAQDLYNVRNNMSGRYKLMNDIDLSTFNGGQWIPIGTSSNPFRGTFDGQGYVIRNLTISNIYFSAGLFGEVSGTSSYTTEIKNVGLENTYINILYLSSDNSPCLAGGVCAYTNGLIYNCYSIGTVYISTYNYPAVAGGICGEGGSISYCYNTGDVSAHSDDYRTGGWICKSAAGGISGDYSTVSYSYNTGNVTSSSHTGTASAGGICGDAFGYSNPISNCYNTGDVSAKSLYSNVNNDESSSGAGGICGQSSINISNCFNTGDISAESSVKEDYSDPYAGGICGYSVATIANCYNAGDVSSSSNGDYLYPYSGGICGYSKGSIANCVVLSSWIYAVNIRYQNSVNCYIIGDIRTSSNKTNNLALNAISGNAINDATSRFTLAQAKDINTYTNNSWNFSTVWDMVPSYDYPQLKGLPSAGPRTLSNDANLASISLSAGSLNPVFNANTTGYTVSVPYEVSSITITATTGYPGAIVAGTGSKNLVVGNNPFPIQVTAENGTTTKTYTVTVNRAPSGDASLSSFSINPGTLNPIFNPEVTSYTATVPYKVQEITVSATTSHPEATTSHSGIVFTDEYMQLLDVGDNMISIEITAEDGVTKKIYTLTVNRAEPSSDADLSKLSLSSGSSLISLDPAFDPGHINYKASVPYGISSITIAAEPNYPGATVEGAGIKNLVIGSNTLTVEVIAEDGSRKPYVVVVTRDELKLTGISLNASTGIVSLIPSFDPDQHEYTAFVPSEVEEITISVAANDPTANIFSNNSGYGMGELSETLSLDIDATEYEITLLNSGMGDRKDYTIMITRTPAEDLKLASLSLYSSIGPISLEPSFDPDLLDYKAYVPYEVNTITIIAAASDPMAMLTGTGLKTLDVGINDCSVIVTAQGGATTKKYNIEVTRYPNDDHDTPKVHVSSVKGRAGEEVTLTVSLENNPGIAGLQLEIGYDASVLKIESQTSVRRGSSLDSLMFSGLGSKTYEDNPFKVIWAGTSNDHSIGEILHITFAILETAKDGEYPVTVSYVPSNTRNENGELISLTTSNGSVKVKSLIYGDADGDGDVTVFDVISIMQYLNDWPITIDEKAADVDGDGEVTVFDAILIMQYLNGWFDEFPVERKDSVPLALPAFSVLAPFSITGLAIGDKPVVSIESPVDPVKPEDIVTLQVDLKNNSGLAGLQLEIGYDSSVFTLESQTMVTRGSALADLMFAGLSPVTYQNNPFRVIWAGTANDYSNGRVLNIQLKVLPDAKNGIYPITVAYIPTNTRDEDGNLIELDCIDGNITVRTTDTPIGVSVSGRIKSYYPKKKTTIQLIKGNDVVYETFIPIEDEYGSQEQSFVLTDVTPGLYVMVVKKDAHAKLTVTDVIVEDEDLDLTKDYRPEIRLMFLRCGDINGDGLINDADLTILWRAGNYNKKTEEADNPWCDLNGDGLINDADLTILWLAYNYNRGAIVIEF